MPMVPETMADIELNSPSGSKEAWHQLGASSRKGPALGALSVQACSTFCSEMKRVVATVIGSSLSQFD